jgi:hypothetical protein
MKTFYLLVTLLLIGLSVRGQQFTINGTIKDNTSSESMIGASIYDVRTGRGTTSNNYGFYSLTLPSDSVVLRVSYVGYETRTIKFFLSGNARLVIGLNESVTLKAVEISASREEDLLESTRMGTIGVPLEQIKAMPAMLGEIDVLKALQLLPGVQSGSEGSSGLYVRGGGPDQNLILLDGVPVYNASHLFGFFSVFNADAINHVELIKGGFPARYGGRLSSVIDINMKEGNSTKIKGEGSIGVVASRFTIEGPIKSDRTSFILSGRRTYIDLLARPFIRKQSKGNEDAGYYFYDLNAKINHRVNENNRVYLSLYAGNDKGFGESENSFQYEGTTEWSANHTSIRWGNITTALRWNTILSEKLFSNITATFSRYRFFVKSDSENRSTRPDTVINIFNHDEYNSGIRDYSLKTDFDFLPNPIHYVRFGGQMIQHLFTPGVLNYRNTFVQDTTVGAQRKSAKEFYLYLEDDIIVGAKLKINAGIHASGFYVDKNFYRSFQPRLAARYILTNKISLKASYVRMTQYIHLLSNVGTGLPTDLWVPSTALIRPEQSAQTSFGAVFKQNKNYEFTVEGYYKKMTGLIEYKDGANFLNIETDWQTKVEVGRGESYGAEFFAQKKTGRISGWAGYTLAWTNRTFANLNNGKTFPYRYDRRHDIEIAAAYQLKENKALSVTWVYGTGMAVTLPKSIYNRYIPSLYAQGDSEQAVDYYGERNSYRMRAYHRLDISYTITKKKRWGERSWTFGAYNLYSRRNPFYINLSSDWSEEEQKFKKHFTEYSLFPIIPSITYRFKF